MVKVTIGIPFYNARDTLADAIRSVFAQTFSDWELIMVDDGSTDGSLELAQVVRDPRVQTISDGVNRGLIYRLNQITGLARSKYLARMDADDLMHPNRLAEQVNVLERDASIDVVGSAIYSIDTNCNVKGKRSTEPIILEPESVLSRGIFVHSTIVGKTEWFRRNLYDSEFFRAEDREVWCRTFQTSNFQLVEEPLLFYREFGNFNLKNYRNSQKALQKIFSLYGISYIGRIRTIKLILMSKMKMILYSILNSIGLSKLLVATRNQRIPKDERRIAEEIVKEIRNTNIPGAEGL